MATTLSGVALTRATELFEPYVLKPYTISSNEDKDEKSSLGKRARKTDSYNEAVRKIDELMGFGPEQSYKDKDDDLRDFILNVQQEDKGKDTRKQDAIEKIGYLLGKERKRRTIPQNRIVVDTVYEEKKKEKKKKEQQLSEILKGRDDYQKELNGGKEGFGNAPIMDSISFENKPAGENVGFSYNKKTIENEEAAKKFLAKERTNPFSDQESNPPVNQESTPPVNQDVITLTAELNTKTMKIASLEAEISDAVEESKKQKEIYEKQVRELSESKKELQEKEKRERNDKKTLEAAYQKSEAMVKQGNEYSKTTIKTINEQKETIRKLEETKNTLLSERSELVKADLERETKYKDTKQGLNNKISLLEKKNEDFEESINELKRKLQESAEKKENNETVSKIRIGETEGRLSEANRNLEIERNNLEDAKKTIASYEKSLKSSTTEREKLEEHIEEIQKTIDLYEEVNRGLLNEASQAATDYNQELEKLSKEKEEISSKLEEEKGKISGYVQKINEMESEIDKLSLDYKEKKLKLEEGHENALNDLKNEAEAYYSKLIKKKEDELIENNKQIEELKKGIENANKTLKEEKEKAGALSLETQKTFVVLENRISELQKSLQDKDSAHSKQIQEYIDSMNSTLGANERVIELNGQVSSLRETNIELGKRILQLEGEINAAKISFARSEQREREMKKEIDDKSFHWWHRYRAVNGFSIYGDRGKAGFDGTYRNVDVMERERAILDQMADNRDKRIWALAMGKEVAEKVDDSNTLPFINPKTNVGGADDPNRKRGKLGSLDYLSGEEQLKKFKLAEGYEINLVASEEQFPELANPVAINFDSKGRLWVATMASYPHWKPKTPMDDKLLIFEDNDNDGKADKCKVFAGGLHQPTGFELGFGGVFIAQQPDILFVKDTDGDDKEDVRERKLVGFCSADSHHGLAAFEWGPDGGLYFQEGTFKYSQVESPYGLTRLAEAGIWRFDPRTEKFGVHVSMAFSNPWGHVFDRWGQDFIGDASPGFSYWAAPISGHIEYPKKHPGGSQHRRLAKITGGDAKFKMKQLYKKRTRPLAGCEIVSSSHFPEDAQGNWLVTNCIGDRMVLNHKIVEKDSGFWGEEVPPIVSCSDGNFRPVACEFAPDGSLYIVDWHNALIGHLQHNLRDPSRDHSHGRIWRVTYKGRDLVKPVKIDGASEAELLDVLKHPDHRVVYRAKREIQARKTSDVMPALKKWISGLDKEGKDYDHHMLEALWTHQAHNVVDKELLNQVLTCKEPRARAAATRVLSFWIDRLDQPLKALKKLVKDEHPRVRLEAVRALSFTKGEEAVEVALEVLESEMDEYLQFTLDETMRVLEE